MFTGPIRWTPNRSTRRTSVAAPNAWSSGEPEHIMNTVQDVLRALRAGEPETILGTPEQPQLDFKLTPYNVETPKHRLELGKDVAALANSGGGALVLGVATSKDEGRNEEVASSLTPFPTDLVDEEQYLKILEAAIYAPLHGVAIEHYLIPESPGKQLAAVIIPEQDADREPFLQVKAWDPETQRPIDAVALPRRSGSHTMYEPVGLLHRDIADGRRSRARPTDQEGERPAVGSPQQSPDPSVDTSPTHATGTVIEEMCGMLEWGEIPALFLTAQPGHPQNQPGDFYSESGLRGAISRHRNVRGAVAFGITYGLETSRLRGSILSVDADMRFLRIQPDGHLVAGAAGTPEFLGWAQDRTIPIRHSLNINPVVLVEWVLEFCRFLHETMMETFDGEPWTIAVAGRRLATADRPLSLFGGRPHSFLPREGRMAPEDTFEQTIAVGDRPETTAFRVLEAIYLWWELSSEEIPFSQGGEVVPSQLEALN